ncbi:hypothetical protein ACK4SH_11845, partial [Proteus mirabilis]
ATFPCPIKGRICCNISDNNALDNVVVTADSLDRQGHPVGCPCDYLLKMYNFLLVPPNVK